ncbi:glycoside hydrolase family 76 protein [Apiospora arundinis]|jgi:mannan endo-1,6-alpha-mannosidase|uniref:Mannan endo-1,6-alpha-mannosidase n=1 Tax=Apiospora arundinis TaxID=335852 RepID=A0ABR2I4E4_9PEZI
MVRLSTSLLAALSLGISQTFAALEVNLDDVASIKKAAKNVADDMLTFYRGDEPGWVPGILPGPPPDGDYYWWHGGAMWGALLDYQHHTGDKDYERIVSEALLFQVGDDRDYNPANWSASMGNDDQAFWGMSAMIAAEVGFKDPPKEQPQWLSLVQAVFNDQTMPERRVTEGPCKGGLRWQAVRYNNGFDYINTIANACYFNMGARLARYTGNQTYVKLVEDTYDTIMRLGYIDKDYKVYDGAHLPDCSVINKAQFSYNIGLLVQGAAALYNMTESDKWKKELDNLLDATLKTFWPEGVAFELSCEGQPAGCNKDMEAYKGFVHRWLGYTAQLAPHTAAKIKPMIKSSVQAAVKQCTGGPNGRFCGFHWTTGVFDGAIGAGQQMNVLGALTAMLMPDAGGSPPLTNNTGGTSSGNYDAGGKAPASKTLAPVTGGDRAGAGFLTALIIAGALGAFAWMSTDGIAE